jgi:predicted dehydrogenase
MAISRRDFVKMGAVGVAAQFARGGSMLGARSRSGAAQPSAAQAGAATSGGRRIGYAVIGLGRIAAHFLPAAAMSARSKITGLVSGHRDKAERIAAQYGVPTDSIYSYEDFDRIAANPAVDAVYVALPNSMHLEYTVRAAKAGKHVICEKPMAISSAECTQMIDACKAARVKLMIAYRLHYEPITLKVLDLVRSGMLGKLQSMEGANGFNIAVGEWRYTKALGGGGSLFDVGIYCLNAYRMYAGEEPLGFQGEVSTPDKGDPRFAEVEENVSWVMRFPSGILATGASTYGAQMPGFYRLNGTLGSVEVGPYGYQGLHAQGSYASSAEKGAARVTIDEMATELDPMQFTHEMDHFSECVIEDRVPNTPGEEGLADMRCIEAIYGSAGVKL